MKSPMCSDAASVPVNKKPSENPGAMFLWHRALIPLVFWNKFTDDISLAAPLEPEHELDFIWPADNAAVADVKTGCGISLVTTA